MSLKVKQVVEAHALLMELTKVDGENPFLPYKTKLALNTRLRKVKADVDHYNTERLALFKEFGSPILEKLKEGETKEPAVTGYSAPTDAEKKASFDAKLKDLLDAEAELEVLKPLPVDSLGENELPTLFIGQLQDHGILELSAEDQE